jgi:hypothetical protein
MVRSRQHPAVWVLVALCPVVVLLALLLSVQSAGALTAAAAAQKHVVLHQSGDPLSPLWDQGVPRRASDARSVPVTDGPCTVAVVVRDPAGQRVVGARVEWGYYPAIAAAWVFGNTATTDADGRCAFSGVRATAHGTLDVFLPDTKGTWWVEEQAFAVGGPEIELQPNDLSIQLTDGGPLTGSYPEAWIETWGSGGGSRRLVANSTYPNGSGMYGYLVPFQQFAPDVKAIVVRFAENEVIGYGTMDWREGPIASVPGWGLGFNQTGAWRMTPDGGPPWMSGPPAKVLSFRVNNSPTLVSVTGLREFPAGAATDDFGTHLMISNTYGTSRFALKLPGDLAPGYCYNVCLAQPEPVSSWGAWTDPRVQISYPYQVCTLKASAKTIRRGGSVRLSGVVPTQGHVDTQAGKGKALILYASTKYSNLRTGPTEWDATQCNWKKVASFKCDGFGKFRSPAVRPTAGTTYVVRYAQDEWYWGAFTGLVRVSVR